MVQLFSPTSGSQELIAVVGSAQHKSLACCIARGPANGTQSCSTHHQPLAQRSGQAKHSNQRGAAARQSFKEPIQRSFIPMVEQAFLVLLLAFIWDSLALLMWNPVTCFPSPAFLLKFLVWFEKEYQIGPFKRKLLECGRLVFLRYWLPPSLLSLSPMFYDDVTLTEQLLVLPDIHVKEVRE